MIRGGSNRVTTPRTPATQTPVLPSLFGREGKEVVETATIDQCSVLKPPAMLLLLRASSGPASRPHSRQLAAAGFGQAPNGG